MRTLSFIGKINILPSGWKKIIQQISETPIHYPHPDHPLIGQRIAEFNTHYKFLFVIYKPSEETQAIEQWLTQHYSDFISTVTASEDQLSILKDNELHYCLIRPDQYIGFVGKKLSELKHYFSTTLFLKD